MSVKSPGWVALRDFVRVFPEVLPLHADAYCGTQGVHRRLRRDARETQMYKGDGPGRFVRIARVVDLQQLYARMASTGTLARNLVYYMPRETIVQARETAIVQGGCHDRALSDGRRGDREHHALSDGRRGGSEGAVAGVVTCL